MRRTGTKLNEANVSSGTPVTGKCHFVTSQVDDEQFHAAWTVKYVKKSARRARSQVTYILTDELWRSKSVHVKKETFFPAPPPVHVKVVTSERDENTFDVFLNDQKVAEMQHGRLRDTNAFKGNLRTLLKRWQDARVPIDAVPATIEAGKNVLLLGIQVGLSIEGITTIEFKIPVQRSSAPTKDR